MGRSSYQRPGVHKRDDVRRPYWYFRVWEWVRGPQGLRRRHSSKRVGYCDEMSLKQAEKQRDEILGPINRISSKPIANEITFGEFVTLFYRPQHVETLAASTRAKYSAHLDKHLLPQFGEKPLASIDARRLQLFFQAKLAHLSWSTRSDIKNILSSIYNRATDFGMHDGANPVSRVKLGRKRMVRERGYLSPEQTEALLALLPADARLLVTTLDVTGCRVSEILGLQEKHIVGGWAQIRQRYWRGDLDLPKNEAAVRDVPLADLAPEYQARMTGDPDRFIFDRGDGQPYSDEELLSRFVRPALKAMHVWKPGLGFHSFRRKTVTELQEQGATSIEAAQMVGHSKVSQTKAYTSVQRERMEELVGLRRVK